MLYLFVGLFVFVLVFSRDVKVAGFVASFFTILAYFALPYTGM